MRKEVVATHYVTPTKGGKWYLCQKHADMIERTLIGAIYEMTALPPIPERIAQNG